MVHWCVKHPRHITSSIDPSSDSKKWARFTKSYCRTQNNNYIVISYNLEQNRWQSCTPPPPHPRPATPPKSRMWKWRVLAFARLHHGSLIWGAWGFAVPFYSVQDYRLDRLYQVTRPRFANESVWTARANQENTLQQPEVVGFYLYDNRSRWLTTSFRIKYW